MSPADRGALRPEGIVVRHVKPRRNPAVSEPGEVEVLDVWMVPQPIGGINGRKGWQKGGYELRLYEEGTFRLTLPNAAGGDGVAHLDRFLCLTKPAYQPGDEWIEIYEHAGEGAPKGEPLFVGTPTKPVTVTTAAIELSGADALALTRGYRETDAGFWRAAPRDVFEHYCGTWTAAVSEDFSEVASFSQISDRFTRETTSSGQVELVAGGGAVRIGHIPGDKNNTRNAALVSTATVQPGDTFRLEMDVDLDLVDTTSTSEFSSAQLGIRDSGSGGPVTGFTLLVIANGWQIRVNGAQQVVVESRRSGPISLAVEQRQRWTYFYIDGRLVGVLANSRQFAGSPAVTVFRWGNVTVKSLLLRKHTPFLLRGADKGDRRLPGRPAPGGLYGEYFDDADIGSDLNKILSPLRKPYASRVDPQINFSSFNALWAPTGPAGAKRYSVRWTGAIYLRLSQGATFARLFDLNGAGRLWIGRASRLGDQVADRWAFAAAGVQDTANLETGDLRGAVGYQDGWCPIVIEYAYRDGAFAALSLQVRGPSGSYIVPASDLSPLGIYSADVRYDSHFGQLEQLRDTAGFQYTCAPRRLESGEFPGQVIPRIREGRDTDFVLDHFEGVEVKRDVDADSVIDTLLVDGQGVAVEGAQLTVEQVNYPGLRDGQHLGVHSEYQSLSDISSRQLLVQRSTTELALRSGPAEEITARPMRGDRYVDRFPIPATPQASLLRWLPGDGVRVVLDRIRVRDLTPRQILGSSWEIRPAGRSSPQVSFRQRPRNLRRELRDVLRKTLNADRNPQGGLSIVPAPLASVNGASAFDTYSRCSLPLDQNSVVKAELVVLVKVDTSLMTIEINGTSTGIQVTAAARYDVTAYARKIAAGDHRCYARLTGGTGLAEYQIELTVRT